MVLPSPEPRPYAAMLRQHFAEHRQTTLLAGLRQDLPFESADPFARTDPCIVPVATLLSMLP